MPNDDQVMVDIIKVLAKAEQSLLVLVRRANKKQSWCGSAEIAYTQVAQTHAELRGRFESKK